MLKVYLAAACLATLGLTATAHALSFSNTVDQSGSLIKNWTAYNFTTKQYESRSADWIDDTNAGDPYPYTFTHQVVFNPEAAMVTSATLEISHAGNKTSGLLAEAWLITDSSSILLGKLSNSYDRRLFGKGAFWVTDTFILQSSFLSSISGSSWTVAFKLAENTQGWDDIYFDKSVLSGTYEPVPEPSTMLLFGAGLAGLVAVSRRK